jgi:CubicO group peptidase (beta-lactamase class C family)
VKSINNRPFSRILIWKVALAILLGVLTFVTIPLPTIAQQLPPSAPAYWPTQGWQRTTTPEEAGIDSAKLAEALLTIREQDIDIHSLLVIRDGAVVVDAYLYPYDGSTFHDVASVTKSIMTTLIGIAADHGKLELDQPMLSYFPNNNNNTIANLDALKERITVQHLASMSSGLNCTQEDDEATLREMKASPDWVRFTLDRKVIWEPGTTFVYCSPGMHLLSAILEHATGMTALDFAHQNLFEPLGIRDVMWLTDPQGYNRGSEGIYLHPYDMAKIGYLWLNNGQWQGKQIVSQEWVNNSVKAQFETGEEEGDDDDYGYGWWVQTDDEPESYSASGRGGQRIIVVPAWNLIIATTGGGFSFEEIEPLLAASIVDMNNSLPANPSAASKLQAALTAISQPPAAQPVALLPDTAHVISGKTFVFEPNPLGIDKAQFEFDNNNNSSEAVLRVTLTGGGQMPPWLIGLDGVYRLSPGEYNLPQGNRGHWVDADTFMLEHDEIANNDHILLLIHFTGDRLIVEGQETAHELGVRLEGRIQR